MKDASFTFRPASAEDVTSIWRLLHAQSFAWREERIKSSLDHLSLLLQGQKLIGVLLADSLKDHTVQWIAIHPFYPEKPFGNLLMEGFRSLQIIEDSRRSLLRNPIPIFCR